MSNDNSQQSSWYSKTYNTDAIISKLMSNDILNKNYDAEGFFKHLIKSIVNKPLLVKQAIYLELRDDIRRMSSVELLEALDKNDLLQLYMPKVTLLGKKVIADRAYANSLNLSMEMIYFLQQIDGEKNVIDLCYANNWTLKHFASIIIKSEEMGFVEHIRSNQIINVFKYLADELDLCTLLVRLNKITEDQLSFALFSLDEMKKNFDDDKTTVEDVLVRMNYITRDKINNILVLKKASELVFESTTNECSEEMEVMQENLDIIMSEKQQIQKELEAFKPLLEAKDRRIKELEEELSKYKELNATNKNPANQSIFKKI